MAINPREFRPGMFRASAVLLALTGGALLAASIPFRAETPGLNQAQREMIENLRAGSVEPGAAPVLACFAPGTDPEIISALTEALFEFNDRAQTTGRWSTTVHTPAGSPAGDPVTLTYSFVPDGTFMRSRIGEPAGPSQMFNWLDGLWFGETMGWQNEFHFIFQRWGELTGINYVFEPNDDGAAFYDSPGQFNTRGDIRIGAKAIDGNSGTLAFNPFPDEGDMTLDAFDSFFDDMSQFNRAFRNVVAHEHGHGIGLLHVCPIDETRLMEPFISSAFNMIQHDDIRGAHQLYGDVLEPDSIPQTATDLGAVDIGDAFEFGDLPGNAIANGATLSIDADGEQDWFQFSIGDSRRLNMVVTPLGLEYDDSPQACPGGPGGANCCDGSLTNSLLAADLAIEIRASDGVTVLHTENANPAGQGETLFEHLLLVPGTYFIGIVETGVIDGAQLYTTSFDFVDSFRSVQFSFPSGVPNLVAPGVETSFDVLITPRDESIVPDSPALNVRTTGIGGFTPLPLTSLGADLFEATIPAQFCDATLEFFVSVEGQTKGIVTSPADGPAGPSAAEVGVVITPSSFDFEITTGWTVEDDPGLTSGTWEAGIPLDCNPADPTSDFDGSGQCFVTDNRQAMQCNSDVDEGETRLVSPVIDLTSLTDPTLTYARWYDNSQGNFPQEDRFIVEVSDDAGANWTLLEVVGPNVFAVNPEVTGGWVEKSFRIEDFIAKTSQFQVRFLAADDFNASFVEAGVDAVTVSARQCDLFPPEECAGDANDDNVVNFADVTAILSNWLNDYGMGNTGPGDANADSVVNFADVTEVLSNWLATCP